MLGKSEILKQYNVLKMDLLYILKHLTNQNLI